MKTTASTIRANVGNLSLRSVFGVGHWRKKPDFAACIPRFSSQCMDGCNQSIQEADLSPHSSQSHESKVRARASGITKVKDSILLWNTECEILPETY